MSSHDIVHPLYSGRCIVSAPLVLGFNFSDTANTDRHWATVTNRDAIDIDQDWAGFSGSLFASSAELTTVSPCAGGPAGRDPNATECVFPATQSWYKPLSGRDARRSIMAILLVNNGHEPRDIGFTWEQVPGLKGTGSSTYCLYDVVSDCSGWLVALVSVSAGELLASLNLIVRACFCCCCCCCYCFFLCDETHCLVSGLV